MDNKYFFIVVAIILFSFSSCVEEQNENMMLHTMLSNATANNNHAKKLFKLMESQAGSYEKLQISIDGATPVFDKTTTAQTNDFGPFYAIPYYYGNDSISGCIIYPVDEEEADKEKRSLNGILGMPLKMNEEVLYNEIPIISRFLYSSKFTKWRSEGLNVKNRICKFADELLSSCRPLTTEENNEYQNINKTRAYPPERMAYIDVSYDAEYIYSAYNGDDEAVIYAFSKDELAKMIKEEFSINRDRLGALCTDVIYSGYRKFSINLFIQNDIFYSYTNTHTEIKKIFDGISFKVTLKGFNMRFSFLISIPPKPTDPTTGGGSGGDSYVGGSSSDNSSNNVGNGYEVNEFKDDCDADKSYSKIDSARKALTVNTLYNFENAGNFTEDKSFKFNEYMNIVNSSNIEHSTSLKEYPGQGYLLSNPISGTQYKVENETDSRTVATIHNHPNNTAPSFQDLKFTAERAADSTTCDKYKATYIYNAEDSSYYAILINDVEKAARFYNLIKTEVDENTNSFIEDGFIETLLIDKNIPRTSDYLLSQIIAVLELKNSGMSLLHITKEKIITSYRVERKMKKGKEMNSLIFITCSN